MVRLFSIVLGYVFGLFQTSYIYGRMHGIDIRNHGSGNAGTTNMIRTLGVKAGAITFAGDVLKCMAAVAVMRLLVGENYEHIIKVLCLYTAAGVILGHNFPFYLGFRGGKGIAATMIKSTLNTLKAKGVAYAVLIAEKPQLQAWYETLGFIKKPHTIEVRGINDNMNFAMEDITLNKGLYYLLNSNTTQFTTKIHI